MPYMPYIIENHSDGEHAYDAFSRLLKERIIFLILIVYVAIVVIKLLLNRLGSNPQRL